MSSSNETCPDCGTRTHNSVCSNCHEEAYIMREQYEFMGPVSDEFADKVKEQEQIIKQRQQEKQEA